jgi:hypothetical protein
VASYAVAGRPVFAAGAAALTLLNAALRRTVVTKMDSLRQQIQANGMQAVPGFRRMHITAVLINLARLVLIVWSLTALKL